MKKTGSIVFFLGILLQSLQAQSKDNVIERFTIVLPKLEVSDETIVSYFDELIKRAKKKSIYQRKNKILTIEITSKVKAKTNEIQLRASIENYGEYPIPIDEIKEIYHSNKFVDFMGVVPFKGAYIIIRNPDELDDFFIAKFVVSGKLDVPFDFIDIEKGFVEFNTLFIDATYKDGEISITNEEHFLW